MKEGIIKVFEDSAKLKQRFAKENADLIVEVVELVAQCFTRGNKVLIFGNGGSASDASHIAGEFVNRFLLERPPLPAIALNTDVAVLTSISNDYDFSEIFVKQLKALGQKGDVAIGISTSGTSPNVVKAILAAREMGIRTVVLTGNKNKGGKLAEIAEFAFVVPSSETPRIQETHITLGHAICQMVDEYLFGSGKKG
ncbi:MAG: D-sedoheptulose 7-phosphate isomerase [Nitrospirae bacterium]|nr:D-sedoheptulose 7-phosphate isomerase [Nitrospirota bacterium]MBI5696787.1 D-sedoheptulose 7-phosphate isomerase [Nitrospirota bacterium]